MLMKPSVLQNGETILFIGDSITDCGRRNPQHAPLGCGYVNFFANFLALRESAKRVHVVNRGIGGNTAEDLQARWKDDALDERPDWLALKIGVNDCNRSLNNPEASPQQSPKVHQDILRQLLNRTRDALPNIRFFLITPFYLSREDHPDAHRARVREHLRAYQQNIRQLAADFDARFLDTQALFESFLQHRRPTEISEDMIHLNELGALLLAEGVYDALGQ